MTSRRSSSSSCTESAVDPTRSQNITVSCRLSAVPAVSLDSLRSAGFGRDSSRKAAIAASSLRRCPISPTPMSVRSSAVSSGSTVASIALSRNAWSYSCSPRPWSHAVMSTCSSPRAPPRGSSYSQSRSARIAGRACRADRLPTGVHGRSLRSEGETSSRSSVAFTPSARRPRNCTTGLGVGG